MADVCRVCTSPDRDKIDVFLANGGLAMVGAQMWDMNAGDLSLHRDEHMRGIAVRVNSDPVRVIARMQDLVELAMENVVDAKNGNENAAQISSAIKVAIFAQKTLAETTGVNKQRDLSLLMPLWQKMQTAILTALEQYPEARQKVLDKLTEVQAEARGLH